MSKVVPAALLQSFSVLGNSLEFLQEFKKSIFQ